jgi:peroxiredoxin
VECKVKTLTNIALPRHTITARLRLLIFTSAPSFYAKYFQQSTSSYSLSFTLIGRYILSSNKVDMEIVRSHRLSLSLAIALVASVAIICLQARYIRSLQLNAEALAARGTIKAGVSVPDVDAVDLSGKRVLLSYAASSLPTLIYVFRPGCPWCERNQKAVNSLTAQISKRYRVIGLSLSDDGLTGFLKAHPVSFPVYYNPSPAFVAFLDLGTTPETIAISRAGRVLASWNGAYIGATQSEVERFLMISLPTPP